MYIYCILCIVLSCFLVKYKCIPCMLLLPFLQQPTTHQLHHQHQPSTIITTPLPPRWAPPAQGVGLTTWQSLSPFNPLCPSLLIHRCHRFRDSFQVSMPFFLFRFVDFFFLFSPSLEIRFFFCFFFTSSSFEKSFTFFKFGFFSFCSLCFLFPEILISLICYYILDFTVYFMETFNWYR